ncbi:transcriptional regulator [Sarcoptes scabiei]|nr:transcriptional regulator [Sarcoptes scabiei]
MPSVSRRILLNVQFAPNIWIPMEEIGALHRSNVTLDCHIEAFPSPINYWTYGPQSKTLHSSDSKFDVSIKEKGYKRHLKLTIRNFDETDVGLYKCNAQNSLGRQVKNVKLYGRSYCFSLSFLMIKTNDIDCSLKLSDLESLS